MPCYRLRTFSEEHIIMAWTKNCTDLNTDPKSYFIHTKQIPGQQDSCNPWDYNRPYWYELTDLELCSISVVITQILIQLNWGDSSKSRYADLDI